MAISASSCTARRRRAGRRSLRRPIRRSPKAMRRTTCGAGRSRGARRASGRSRPAAPTSRASSGAARCRAACFAPRDHGQSWEMIRSLWDHPKRKQWMGGGADLPGIHSIWSTRAIPTCGLRSRPAASGSPRIAAPAGPQRGEGMRAEYAPPEQTHDPIAQDVHCLVQCPAAPQRMWVQHHNGIFVSSDEGKTFSEITGVEPSAFGFPVVVHPREPDTAWFVPEIKDEKRIPREGKLVVTRTRDGGKKLRCPDQGAAAGARLRRRLSPRARARRGRRTARLRLDDRRPLGERGPGRQLGMRDAHAAAGLCGAVRMTRRRRHLSDRLRMSVMRRPG